MRYEVSSQASATYMAAIPEGIDTHFDTTNFPVCNVHEGTAEEQQLVYEVRWIEELGMWRSFLTSRRTVRV